MKYAIAILFISEIRDFSTACFENSWIFFSLKNTNFSRLILRYGILKKWDAEIWVYFATSLNKSTFISKYIAIKCDLDRHYFATFFQSVIFSHLFLKYLVVLHTIFSCLSYYDSHCTKCNDLGVFKFRLIENNIC